MAREDSLIWMIITPIMKWLKTKHAWASIAGTFVLLVGLAWLFAYQAEAFPASDPYNAVIPAPHPGVPDDAIQQVDTLPGYASEGTPIDERIDLLGNTAWTMRIRFVATDEPPTRNFRWTNEPDNFDVTLTMPDGTVESKSATATSSNTATIDFIFDWEDDGGLDISGDGENIFLVTIECTEAGDQHPLFSPFGRRDTADQGNEYTLVIDYSYTD
jgi:hypothetical protein